MPKGRYLDPEFQQLELDKLFPRTWLMACRLEELPGVGSYVEYRIGTHSILVVRESADSIRATTTPAATAAPAWPPGAAGSASLICPFHGWRWNLDGSIRLVLDREEFVPRSDEDLGLEHGAGRDVGRVRVHQHGPEAEPLLEYLDPIPTVFAPFQFENMRYRWMKGVTAALQLEDRARRVPRGVPRARHPPAARPLGQGATTTSPR